MGRGALASQVPFAFTPLVGSLLPRICGVEEDEDVKLSVPRISTPGGEPEDAGLCIPSCPLPVCNLLVSFSTERWRGK